MALLLRIRQKVIDGDYFLSQHAREEMHDDNLERDDVAQAILRGRIERRFTADPRGTRYCLVGPARDGRPVNVVLRFHEGGGLIVITVYVEE